MARKIYIGVFLVFVLALPSVAQYITLPDPQFVQFLKDNYPSVLNANLQLDTNKAKTIVDKMVAGRKNIKNAEGVQYFHKLTQLQLDNNGLESMPNIDSLQDITVLLLDTNRLKKIPTLTGLSSLVTINVYNNLLDTVPSVKGLRFLKRLFISNNKIRKFPDVTGCDSLAHIVASNNLFTEIPDLRGNPRMRRLLLTYCRIKYADFSRIPTVTEIHLNNNLLTEFPDISARTNLKELKLAYNKLDSIPDMTGFTQLIDLDLAGNKFTFEDLVKFKPNPNMALYRYTDQALVGTSDSVSLREKDNYSVTWPAKDPLPDNQYVWYQNGLAVATTNVPNFTFGPLAKSDAGTYAVECRNPRFSKLVLRRQNLKVSIGDCFQSTEVIPTYTSASCKYPVEVKIDENVVSNPRKPFTYWIKNLLTGDSMNTKGSALQLSLPGSYQLSVMDSAGCKYTLPQALSATKPINCEPIFYPGLDGPESLYYIEAKGKAEMFNSKGIKVREMEIPNYWDGRDQYGKGCESGMYLILINNKDKIELSLMQVN